MEKLVIPQVIIVEGKYDKIKLSSIIDGLIIQTNGFRIYKDKEKLALIKTLAQKKGVVIVTDSDVAGFKLRGFIRSIAKDAKLFNIYIPQIEGKEKRKESYSKEGFLGVEGIEAQTLRELFIKSGCISGCAETKSQEKRIERLDFFEDGLMGGENSSEKRQALLKKIQLPSYVTTNSLLQIINSLISYEDYKKLIDLLEDN